VTIGCPSAPLAAQWQIANEFLPFWHAAAAF
jgi:hypothetical protein